MINYVENADGGGGGNYGGSDGMKWISISSHQNSEFQSSRCKHVQAENEKNNQINWKPLTWWWVVIYEQEYIKFKMILLIELF